MYGLDEPQQVGTHRLAGLAHTPILHKGENRARFVAKIGGRTPFDLVVDFRFVEFAQRRIDGIQFFAPPIGRKCDSLLASGDAPVGEFALFVGHGVLRRLLRRRFSIGRRYGIPLRATDQYKVGFVAHDVLHERDDMAVPHASLPSGRRRAAAGLSTAAGRLWG